MGTEDGADKSRAPIEQIKRVLWRYIQNPQHFRLLLGSIMMILLLPPLASVLLPSPETIYQPTFSEQQGLQRVPARCRDVAQHFYQTQQRKQHQETLVIACHRRWCRSWLLGGHCEPCGGIGDRMRFVLNQVQEASQAGRRVLLDYTLEDVAILDTALYVDKWGWWAEWLRFRSYDVSKRRPAVWNDNNNNNNHAPLVQFAHAKAVVSTLLDRVPYDVCYFHALFQPAPRLQRDLDRHMDNLKALAKPASPQPSSPQQQPQLIGIHFRTGDQAAFGVPNLDTRLVTSWQDGWERMYQCALDLSRRLSADDTDTHANNTVARAFFVATDHAELKTRLQREQKQRFTNSKTSASPAIYVTEPLPRSFLRGIDGDRDAWMEIFLLSLQQGLVVNLRPDSYKGTAGRTSFFSILAQQMGGLANEQVMECRLDR